MCNHVLIVVDVQPEYSSWIRQPLLNNIAALVNTTPLPTAFLWVGEDISNDTASDVRQYLIDIGVTEGRLDDSLLVEKGYGFLREAMDMGVDPEDIVASTKALLERREHSGICCGHYVWIPGFHTTFDYADKVTLVGGGRNECLAEVALLLEAKGIEVDIREDLCY